MTLATLDYFYIKDEEGVVVISEETGESIIAPSGQRASVAELKKMILAKKPKRAIDKYKQFVLASFNYAKLDEYLEKIRVWKKETEKVQAHNEAYHRYQEVMAAEAEKETLTDDDENPITAQSGEVDDTEEQNINALITTESVLAVLSLLDEPIKPEFVPFEPLTLEQLDVQIAGAISAAYKETRASEVSNIKVTVGGMVFDGDEESQARMDRAARVMEKMGRTSMQWKLADNSFIEVTADELVQAIALAGEEQTAIWAKYG
jgi:hypothetical protein